MQRAFKPAVSDMKYLQDFGLPDNVVANPAGYQRPSGLKAGGLWLS
jgi:hypothetical protein